LGEIKPGWQKWRFDQIAHSVTDRVDDPSKAGVEHYIGLEHLDSDSLKIRRWGSPDDVSATKLLFEPGDIIFGRRRAYQRKLGVAKFRGIASAHSLVLRAKPSVALPEFLPFFMQSDLFMDLAQRISVGSLSPTINWKTLAKQEFALPPLEEQHRLVGLLQSSSQVVDAQHDAAKSARQICRALGKEFFISNTESTNCTIAEVGTVRNGTTPRRARHEYWNGDIPWLPTGKVNDRVISVADEYISAKALKECSLSMIPAGSTLIAMIGQGKTRGMAARLTIDATINQNFASVTPGPEVDPMFLFYQLEAKYEALRYWSQGTNQQALNCRLVSEFPFWRPSMTRQLEIRDVLSEAEQAFNAAEVRLAMARSQQQRRLADSLYGVVP